MRGSGHMMLRPSQAGAVARQRVCPSGADLTMAQAPGPCTGGLPAHLTSGH